MGWFDKKKKVRLDGYKSSKRASQSAEYISQPELSRPERRSVGGHCETKQFAPREFLINNTVMFLEPDPVLVERLTDDVQNVIDRLDQGHEYESSVDDELGYIIDEDGSVLTKDQWHAYQQTLYMDMTRTQRKYQEIKVKKLAYLMKAYYYRNSRLPESLPSICLYLDTWPFILLAAHCSAVAYRRPANGDVRSFGIGNRSVGKNSVDGTLMADDAQHILMFFVKGTVKTSLRSWARALDTTPTSPFGFLDDAENYCHAGFLSHARSTIEVLAENLRAMLEENPLRRAYTLLFAGHSAGGAIVSLLYAHLLSNQTSNLSILQNCFKRVHCITFGAPPISILPLHRPPGRRFRNWIFYSFLNEGDPVGRAEGTYITSLAKLIASPIPRYVTSPPDRQTRRPKPISSWGVAATDARHSRSRSHGSSSSKPYYPLAKPLYINAGRLIILRTTERTIYASDVGRAVDTPAWERAHASDVKAVGVGHEDIADALWGDLYLHQMDVYLSRIQFLSDSAMRQGRRYDYANADEATRH